MNMNNNFGINNLPINNNPINNIPIMNNIQMNNDPLNNMMMNNMPMNNQPNLIETYQNQIKLLEQIIKQKDLEITYLKNLLNINGINYQNQNFMNISQMGIADISNEHYSKGKEIVVTFLDGNRNGKYTCFENDFTYKLFEKINPNSDWRLVKYTCNGKKLYPFSFIKNSEIENGSIVSVGLVRPIFFNGYKKVICINIDENYPIKKAIKHYLLRIGEENNSHDFKFMYNANHYNIEDKIPIKNIFPSGPDPTVTVIKYKN